MSGEKSIVGPGKSELISSWKAERNTALKKLKEEEKLREYQYLVDSIREDLESFTNEYFLSKKRYSELSPGEKEAVKTLYSSECKKWAFKRLTLPFIAFVGFVAAALLFNPVLFTISVSCLGILWLLACPLHPLALSDKLKYLIMKKNIFSILSENKSGS